MLGKLIHIGRAERGFSDQDLTDRATISRATLFAFVHLRPKA
jgi:hypothetical protein